MIDLAEKAEREVSLDWEVARFATAADQVLLGDLEIRRSFARQIMALFAITNGGPEGDHDRSRGDHRSAWNGGLHHHAGNLSGVLRRQQQARKRPIGQSSVIAASDAFPQIVEIGSAGGADAVGRDRL